MNQTKRFNLLHLRKQKKKSLGIKKGVIIKSVQTSILNAQSNTFLPYLTNITNKCIENCYFVNKLKLTEIIPKYKRGNPLDKKDYRAVNLLSCVSKIFKK